MYIWESDIDGVLGVLRRFAWYDGQPPQGEGKTPYEAALTSILLNCLANGQPIPLLLPSSPWKNPNKDKVLSSHPDLGEELGLARLNMLCEELQKVYLYGAVLVLVSDGPVYNGSFRFPSLSSRVFIHLCGPISRLSLQLRLLVSSKPVRVPSI